MSRTCTFRMFELMMLQKFFPDCEEDVELNCFSLVYKFQSAIQLEFTVRRKDKADIYWWKTLELEDFCEIFPMFKVVDGELYDSESNKQVLKLREDRPGLQVSFSDHSRVVYE